jgi:hypothetical protein
MSLLSPELSGKRLELLRQASGRPAAIAIFYNPDDPPAVDALKETQDAARQVGVQVTLSKRARRTISRRDLKRWRPHIRVLSSF